MSSIFQRLNGMLCEGSVLGMNSQICDALTPHRLFFTELHCGLSLNANISSWAGCKRTLCCCSCFKSAAVLQLPLKDPNQNSGTSSRRFWICPSIHADRLDLVPDWYWMKGFGWIVEELCPVSCYHFYFWNQSVCWPSIASLWFSVAGHDITVVILKDSSFLHPSIIIFFILPSSRISCIFQNII